MNAQTPRAGESSQLMLRVEFINDEYKKGPSCVCVYRAKRVAGIKGAGFTKSPQVANGI